MFKKKYDKRKDLEIEALTRLVRELSKPPYKVGDRVELGPNIGIIIEIHEPVVYMSCVEYSYMIDEYIGTKFLQRLDKVYLHSDFLHVPDPFNKLDE